MTDWKQIARATGIELSDEELARTVAPLESLEPVFRPLAAALEPDDEPATIFNPEAGS
jgi:hypothetical protein